MLLLLHHPLRTTDRIVAPSHPTGLVAIDARGPDTAVQEQQQHGYDVKAQTVQLEGRLRQEEVFQRPVIPGIVVVVQ